MANYFIAYCTKKTTNIIDLEKLLGKYSKKLELLDELTVNFESEKELKHFLITKGLFSTDNVDKNLNIVYKNSGKLKRLPVFYSEHKKIMNNVEVISKEIYKRESEFNMYTSESIKYDNLRSEFSIFTNLIGNVNFLSEISRHYSIGNAKYNPQFLNVSDINIFLSDVRSNGGDVFYPNYMYIALYELFKSAMYKIEKNPDKNIVKLNYRGYRDLVNFIYKYKLDKNLIEKNNIDDEVEQMKLEQIETSFSIDNNRSYDYNEEIMYEEGFAPNSEELKAYKNYLESLQGEDFSTEDEKKHRK